jgi:hypothetical protein
MIFMGVVVTAFPVAVIIIVFITAIESIARVCIKHFYVDGEYD